MSERAAAAKPWPRISTTLLPPGPRARSRPWALFPTSRFVSPNRSAMSHTGTSAPMKLPEWITGRSGVLVTVNGSTASAWAWTTAITSGRAS
jgi:hypothetical protein